ncbi:MAG: ABC transporter permease subunit [Anaerolineae bacterium]
MVKFILRRFGLLLLTMFLVSVIVFGVTEAAPGNIARNVLGAYITPEQERSFLAQMGLDRPIYQRYLFWLVGNDWLARSKIGMPLKQIRTEKGFLEWWAVEPDGTLIRWKLEGDNLIAIRKYADGRLEQTEDNGRWRIRAREEELARLKGLRAEVETDERLLEADRVKLLAQMDTIIQVLESTPEQQDLLTALAGPEKELDAFIDPNATRLEEGLLGAAPELARDELYEALVIYRNLSVGAMVNIPPQQIANKMNRAAGVVAKIDPDLAEQLTNAQNAFQAGNVDVALETLTPIMPALEEQSAAYIHFVDALQGADFFAAEKALREMADPEKTPLDSAHAGLLARQLGRAGGVLRKISPGFKALSEASTSLTKGEIGTAHSKLLEAADHMGQVARNLRMTELARLAKVQRTFWGVDTNNRAVLWERGGTRVSWQMIEMGMRRIRGGAVEYLPVQRGLLRGDPGVSVRTYRPVGETLLLRLRNSLVLAAIAFVVVMPLALVLGLIAGLNEGKPIDRVLSIFGLVTTVTPEFVTGIFLILIFSYWLKLVPGATVFGEKAPWERPDMLILPVATLTLLELGYVLRMTRASMSDVMRAPYIRTAFLKGLPYWRIVFKHAIRNALIAPITVIMLHVNWLVGGIVIVEAIFGYPGLGKYLLEAALFKDFNAIEAGAMVLVTLAVGTQLLADIAYTFLNPRIRYQ